MYEAGTLQRQVYVGNRVKTMNESIYYNVDKLHTAIYDDKKISFRYTDWAVDFTAGARVKRQVRKNGRRYAVSPWALTWNNENYYLVGFDAAAGRIKHYRVDKMSGVRVLDAPRRGQEQFADLDLPAYLRKHFGMYGGPEHRVTLRCTADLEGAMRERFGATPMFLPEENGCFHFDVPICVSDQFYGWVCGFGGKIEVVAPPEVRQGMREMTARLAEQHQ